MKLADLRVSAFFSDKNNLFFNISNNVWHLSCIGLLSKKDMAKMYGANLHFVVVVIVIFVVLFFCEESSVSL